MLTQAIVLDAAMPVSEVLARLARYGLWTDPQHPAARDRIAPAAARLDITLAEAEKLLAQPSHLYGAAIRRQLQSNILWYGMPVDAVLQACMGAAANASLLDALGLHETDSEPTVEATAAPPSDSAAVVTDNGAPVAVHFPDPVPRMAGGLRGRRRQPSATATTDEVRDMGTTRGRSRTAAKSSAVTPPPTEVRAWPRLEAPRYVVAAQPFEVVVGLAKSQQAGVAGGELTLTAPAGADAIDVTVELIADGVDAPEGWSKPLHVLVADPTAAEVRFKLVGRPPAGPEPVHLTTLEVRYVVQGSVCGTASRPLMIGAAAAAPANLPYGAPWLEQAATASAVHLAPDDLAADLTIELVKPDRNAAVGRYVCRLYSPHAITADRGPHDIDLGQDAKTFAKEIVDNIRLYSAEAVLDNTLRSYGLVVYDKLPQAAFDALREVAQKVAPAVPAVLIVSADPYVPWELALIEPPLDPSRPPYLGAQALVGRWLREGGATPTAAAPGAQAPAERPPVQPPSRIGVRNMAVMGGFYQPASGLAQLPQAEEEAKALTQQYHAIPLAASPQAIKQLLDATLEHNFQLIGGAEAVHFAGHGDFDPTRPDSSALFLSEGLPLRSILFRSAKYGGARQPLIFLNACMIGIGGELLGDMGGFPGNCLRGGFGGVLGALWEVDDVVAHDFALEFWKRALPAAGQQAEPVGAILRDLRAQYLDTDPVSTYLAYVYYGHPRLTLQRVP